MDSVLFDQMLSERTDLEAKNNEPSPEGSGGGTVGSDYVVAGDLATGTTPEESTGGGTVSDYYVDSELATSTTVPITNEGATGLDLGAKKTSANTSARSSTSSSASSDQRSIGFGSASLYQPEFMAPKINYERANEAQKLAAVIGREFDRPNLIASTLQKLVSEQPGSEVPIVKFVPFTLRRKVLLKGSFDSRELRKHDLICMCYNASEARILLTGPDGFYTSLLKHVESLLGEDKHTTIINRLNLEVTSFPVLPTVQFYDHGGNLKLDRGKIWEQTK